MKITSDRKFINELSLELFAITDFIKAAGVIISLIISQLQRVMYFAAVYIVITNL